MAKTVMWLVPSIFLGQPVLVKDEGYLSHISK